MSISRNRDVSRDGKNAIYNTARGGGGGDLNVRKKSGQSMNEGGSCSGPHDRLGDCEQQQRCRRDTSPRYSWVAQRSGAVINQRALYDMMINQRAFKPSLFYSSTSSTPSVRVDSSPWRDTSSVVNKNTTQQRHYVILRSNAVSRVENEITCHRAGQDRYDIQMLL